MPYIPQEDRRALRENLRAPNSPGELNFLFTESIIRYIENRAMGLRYHVINYIIGALESCKLEFYRRVAAPREQEVCYNVGDVYKKPEDSVPSVWWEEAQGQGQEVLRRLSRPTSE